ncbi:hypothetical protein V8G54_026429 [Vigna mungo]|uniref:Uncharacterized protein n=1 Tax=Vigna mungo TaxID=3915 RepID=A0AAQ3MYR5_VIGMU
MYLRIKEEIRVMVGAVVRLEFSVASGDAVAAHGGGPVRGWRFSGGDAWKLVRKREGEGKERSWPAVIPVASAVVGDDDETGERGRTSLPATPLMTVRDGERERDPRSLMRGSVRDGNEESNLNPKEVLGKPFGPGSNKFPVFIPIPF